MSAPATELEQRKAGMNMAMRLLSSRITMFGTNEEGELLLRAVSDSGKAIEIIIFVEDGELTLSEAEPPKEAPL